MFINKASYDSSLNIDQQYDIYLVQCLKGLIIFLRHAPMMPGGQARCYGIGAERSRCPLWSVKAGNGAVVCPMVTNIMIHTGDNVTIATDSRSRVTVNTMRHSDMDRGYINSGFTNSISSFSLHTKDLIVLRR